MRPFSRPLRPRQPRALLTLAAALLLAVAVASTAAAEVDKTREPEELINLLLGLEQGEPVA